MDLRTVKEREREQKHNDIITRYCNIAHETGCNIPSRIIGAMAEEFGMTPMGIRTVLLKNNIITTKKSHQQ